METITKTAASTSTRVTIAIGLAGFAAGLAFGFLPFLIQQEGEEEMLQNKKNRAYFAQQEREREMEEEEEAQNNQQQAMSHGQSTGCGLHSFNLSTTTCALRYRAVSYTCHDGYSFTSPQGTQCGSPQVFQNQANWDCQNRCNPTTGKCGINSFQLSRPCGTEVDGVTYTCRDLVGNYTTQQITNTCGTPQEYRMIAQNVCDAACMTSTTPSSTMPMPVPTTTPSSTPMPTPTTTPSSTASST